MKTFLLLLLSSVYLTAAELPKPKNVIVIVADDHAMKVTGAYGNTIVKTPNIDQLSNEGLTFTNTYCNSPICSASRQSMLTGKYPHATGVNLLFTPFQDEGNETIAEYLKTKGYSTALVGKSHFNNWAWSGLYKNGAPKHGFDTIIDKAQYRKFLKENNYSGYKGNIETYSKDKARGNISEWMNSRVLPHPVADKFSEGTFLANQANEFISKNHQKPFFLWLAFHQPHHPYYFPIEYAGKYKAQDMILPPTSSEDDRWVPKRYRNLSNEQRRGIIASYYTSTSYMDKNIGLVMKRLKEQGLEKDTLIIYVSDNGYLLNEHKRFEKHTMWEEAIHQPMIFKMGSNFNAGKKVDALIEYIDLAPTITDLIGAGHMKEAQGQSFKSLFTNTDAEFKEYAFTQYLEDNLAMICDKQWKYVFTTGSRDLGIGYKTGLGGSGLTHRLYNLKNDPNEHTDVSKHPENRKILKQLKQKMLNRFMETHPDASKCPSELTLEGKLVWFCEPRDVGTDQSLVDEPVRVFQKR
ncbi:MAG: sulfatase-like hydrolase/transferase [Lentisphaeraceae bacterium]|nr:sulfatase-like hydrolase/transferase [Lentisphaeraceae bacterium]